MSSILLEEIKSEHPLLHALIEADIPVSLRKDHIEVGGFYKSGHASLFTPSAEDLSTYGTGVLYIAVTRYQRRTPIFSLEDLVCLNHDWWVSYTERTPGHIPPHEKWIPLLEEFGYVSRTTDTVTYFRSKVAT